MLSGARVASDVALHVLAVLGIEGGVKTEAEAGLARLKGAARMTAILVTHAMTRAAAEHCVLAADMRINTAYRLRGAVSFLDHALLAVSANTLFVLLPLPFLVERRGRKSRSCQGCTTESESRKTSSGARSIRFHVASTSGVLWTCFLAAAMRRAAE